jgi:hypothetical protein
MLTLLFAAAAHAEDRELAQAPVLPKYRQECGACHVAYPPRLLGAVSWQRLMSDLPRHFGTDASLDTATAREIAAWLAAHAGAQAAPPQDRITRSTWFVREHAEVPGPAWQRPAVRSAANCIGCHAQADQGDFNEHTVRIPR